MAPSLYLSYDADFDWLTALEYGRVDDGQHPDCWRVVSEQFAYLHDRPGGRVAGFKVLDFSRFDLDDVDVKRIWSGPRFDVPILGLTGATAGQVALAARARFGSRSTLNRQLFTAAIQAEGEEALALWGLCLEAGDAMAHFALGYTLYELGRFPAAYQHLRRYTEIAPHQAWNWCWYGYAAEAVGEPDEARRAYKRALELDAEVETDAAERLAACLDAPG